MSPVLCHLKETMDGTQSLLGAQSLGAANVNQSPPGLEAPTFQEEPAHSLGPSLCAGLVASGRRSL